MESGAADKVVRGFLSLFGEKRAGDAITASSYILSIPIFFDTFFMLLLPLARALRIRLGKDYLLFVMAICCAGTVTHSMLAPHPGPLAMAETLNINLGVTILAGFLLGIIPVLSSWTVVKWINRRMEIPLRDIPGMGDSTEFIGKSDSELPSTFASLLPVLLPIVLIAAASIFQAIPSIAVAHPILHKAVEFIGNRNVALFVGAFLAVMLLMRVRHISLAKVAELIGPPLETAGMVILITSAGGAFGLMLKNAGVGDSIQALVNGSRLDLIVVSWTLAAVIRIAQGSATVAMLTTAGMLAPMVSSGSLPYHPVYIFCAIGFGAMMLSWMNDSGFWVVGRLSGFTEKETLKTWTIVVSVNSIAGLIVTLLASRILPLRALHP
jgi:GntP family gluconate:H+ symporter